MVYGLYIASLFGAVALILMMPRPESGPRGPINPGLISTLKKIGMLLGVATLGGLWLGYSQQLNAVEAEARGLPPAAMMYYYVFSAIAIIAAVRVITHTKPVYSALWFVMVVMASAGLFITLDAEFMAMAMVIIYGGAILVTYMFVIMLAAEPGDARGPGADTANSDTDDYNSTSREPIAACTAGFLLLAVLLSVAFSPIEANPDAAGRSDAQILTSVLTDRPAGELYTAVNEDPRLEQVAPVNTITNSERVGLDLFEAHPLGLELAGVILLVSLVGAVIIARQPVTPESTGA